MTEKRKDYIWGVPLTVIIGLLVYIGTGLWWGANLTADVKFETKTRESCITKIENRMDRLEEKIDKILEKVLHKP